ncbi:helix-turn-helix domain-containing protein [Micromonospora sp. MMS20-R2-29]|uniref:Helix-turn-helix domain-containing protein n=1 Tax=Micromonospora humidisoli TaxID=2807622 RepID=A0ABS2J9Z9_9ACTN|nr:helix-turn-helix domain-containing protein [Micromonospora humidisoli]
MAAPKDLPDVGGFIRDLRRNAKISLRQLAEQAGVSNPYLSQIERGLRKPSAEVLQQLASALRVSTPAMYLRAGLLDDKEGQGVLAAIAVDPDLTMAQKQSLSQIYETFRRENTRLAEAEAATNPPAEDEPVAATDEAPGTAQPVVTDRTAAMADRPVTNPGPATPAPAGGPSAPAVPTEAAAGITPAATGPVTPEGTPTEAVLESVARTEAGTAPAPGSAADSVAAPEFPATGTRTGRVDAAPTTSTSRAAGAAEEELS